MAGKPVVICEGITRTYQDDAVPVHALRGIARLPRSNTA